MKFEESSLNIYDVSIDKAIEIFKRDNLESDIEN